MKKYIINKCMNYLKDSNKYSETQLKEIEYGLVSIYLTFSKTFIILILTIILGIFKEAVLFMTIYGILRTTGFGLHASKSWICLLISLMVFILIPYLCLSLTINKYVVQLICLICTLLMYKNAPADTKKHPIVSKKRRNTYKYISTILAVIYSVIAIVYTNSFMTNCLVFALILENVLISPLTYSFFGVPYNNYINFLKSHPDMAN